MSEAVSYTVRQGDTSVIWKPGHRDADSGDLLDMSVNYTCAIAVKGTAINRAVTDLTGDNLRFIAALTPTETATLTENEQYTVAVQVQNLTLTPPFSVEKHVTIFVAEGLIATV